MMTVEDFRTEIQQVTRQVYQQIQNRREGLEGPGSEEDLEFIVQELTCLETALAQGNLPPVNQRWLSAARMVTDSWDLDDPLGTAICKLGYIYRHEVETSGNE